MRRWLPLAGVWLGLLSGCATEGAPSGPGYAGIPDVCWTLPPEMTVLHADPRYVTLCRDWFALPLDQRRYRFNYRESVEARASAQSVASSPSADGRGGSTQQSSATQHFGGNEVQDDSPRRGHHR